MDLRVVLLNPKAKNTDILLSPPHRTPVVEKMKTTMLKIEQCFCWISGKEALIFISNAEIPVASITRVPVLYILLGCRELGEWELQIAYLLIHLKTVHFVCFKIYYFACNIKESCTSVLGGVIIMCACDGWSTKSCDYLYLKKWTNPCINCMVYGPRTFLPSTMYIFL